jgi:hypothetical protein
MLVEMVEFVEEEGKKYSLQKQLRLWLGLDVWESGILFGNFKKVQSKQVQSTRWFVDICGGRSVVLWLRVLKYVFELRASRETEKWQERMARKFIPRHRRL